MDDFIPLDRRFSDYREDLSQEYDDAVAFWGSELLAPYQWKGLLANRTTVVIGEGGTGKSFEFRQKTNELRAAGDAAFFCPLENLDGLTFGAALEIGSEQELQAWLEGTAEGWFFLDAADEAKLKHPRQFERAIAKFINLIEDHKERAHIFISTRPHAWGTFSENDMLCSRLGLSLPKENDGNGNDELEESETNISPDAANEEASENASTESTSRPQLKLVQLAPLDQAQIKAFAGARGVTDLDRFMDAIERANADVFANRPSDLPGLIDIWRKTGRIGSYCEVVLNNIQLKLKEYNATYKAAGNLTPERALLGAERLAAAVTMSRKTSLLLSEVTGLNDHVRDAALDPRDVLLDWRPIEVQELLGRALLDESLYGTVRFHHRTAREYLTARWLCRLLRQRKHRRAVRQILFRNPYGALSTIVVPSLKPVAGWLSLWDQGIRDDILRIDPKVLLEFGDASALPPQIKGELLRDFAERYAGQSYTPLTLNLREVRRLADPRLAGVIRELLERYRGHEDVQHLLLRLIREGSIAGFGATALALITAADTDTYSRVYSIEVVGRAGNAEEKNALKELLLASPQELDHQVLAAGIGALFPGQLSTLELGRLLELCAAPGDYSYDALQAELDQLEERVENPTERLELLRALHALLARPPHIGEWCPVSRRYAWLLRPAMALAGKILNSAPNGPFSEAELVTVGMAMSAAQIGIYTGDAPKQATELLAANMLLKHAVFWHQIEAQRLNRPNTPLRDWWNLRSGSDLKRFTMDDTAQILAAMREKPLLDDRLVAQSVLLTLHRWPGTDQILDDVRAASSGTAELEAALNNYLNPPEMPPEQAESQRRLREAEAQRDRREQEQRADRAAWIEQLRQDRSKVGSLERAAEGVIFNNTLWLLEELRTSRRDNSRFAQPRWQSLIPDFGNEVAEAFRDFCIAFWRLYTPSLQSETAPRGNSTPWAVIIGLSGIAMEAAGSPDWAAALTGDEAALATRYALWEINKTPPWLTQLWRTHRQHVETVLLHEISWELKRTRDPEELRSGYVLYRLRWGARDLGLDLRAAIISLLTETSAHDPEALSEALTIVLRDAAPVPDTFLTVVADRAENAANNSLKGWWLAALLCLNAEEAIPRLEAWVDGADAPRQAEECISVFLSHIWGDRFHNLNPAPQSFLNAPMLLRLIKLSHTYIRLDDDIEHIGTYSPGLRDHAQDARNQLLKLLCEIPGQPTYEALLELSRFHPQQYPRDRMLILAERRAEADCEADPWEPHGVAEFAANAEQEPRTQYDLHLLALNRLDDLKLDLEEGDESEASILQRVEDEVELRKVIANRLKHVSSGKYTTGSEEELADRTRTDIRLHNPAVDARIPIEIKIADKRKWTASTLKERLKNQLIGQYLREARYGIFLLIRRGNSEKGDRQTWVANIRERRRTLIFEKLVEWLQEEAKELLRANPSIDGLEVVGIDLTRRQPDSRRSRPDTPTLN